MDRRALLLAFVVALLGVVLLVLYTKRYEREMSGGDKVKLLIAIKPIERGKPITDDMLSTRDVPQALRRLSGVRLGWAPCYRTNPSPIPV